MYINLIMNLSKNIKDVYDDNLLLAVAQGRRQWKSAHDRAAKMSLIIVSNRSCSG